MAYFMILLPEYLLITSFCRSFWEFVRFSAFQKISTAAGMGFAVMFVMTISTIVTFLIYYTFLQPYELTFMTTVTFILVIAALVQMVEIIIKKVSPALYQALGIFLPLITTNCAVLGIAILTIQKTTRLLPEFVTLWRLQWALRWPLSSLPASANA